MERPAGDLDDGRPVHGRGRRSGFDADGPLVVRRGMSKSRGRRLSDRPDLVVEAQGRTIAVTEVKLPAGLGVEQLERYDYVPESDREQWRFLAVSQQRIRLDTAHAEEWGNPTWEDVLALFASSIVLPWLATTAAAWLEQIETQVLKSAVHMFRQCQASCLHPEHDRLLPRAQLLGRRVRMERPAPGQ